jgi:hypothetical protein
MQAKERQVNVRKQCTRGELVSAQKPNKDLFVHPGRRGLVTYERTRTTDSGKVANLTTQSSSSSSLVLVMSRKLRPHQPALEFTAGPTRQRHAQDEMFTTVELFDERYMMHLA